MNMNNLTIKSQEAIAGAQMIATSNQQQRLDNLHLLKSLFDMDQDVIPYLIKKQDANPKTIQQVVERQIQAIPKVQGGDIYMSNGLQQAIQQAMVFSNELGDDFVSLEHLFYGILKANDEASKILKDAGITEKGLKTAIQELRKGRNVTSSTGEDTYNALNKYSMKTSSSAT